MKQNAKSDKPFTLNSHVLERFGAWENLVSGGKVKV
jgi:CRISP-associated protein Cas1